MSSVTTSPAGNTRAHATGTPHRRGRARRWLWPYAMLSPFLLVFLAFFVGPLVFAGAQSLFRQRLIGGPVFVGLEHYAGVLTDESFWGGVGRILVYGAVFTPLTLGLALLFALALDAGAVRWGPVYRLLFFLPYAVPGVIATLMWGFLYGPSFGPLTDIAGWVGLEVNFFSEELMLPSIGNIGVWLYVGYDMIVFYAALQAIPRELYEAAAIDGAGRIRTALRIKVPNITPAITMMVLFSIIGTLQLFTEPAVLYPNAPDVIGDDYTPNYYAYSLASTGSQLNYVSALSFVLGGLVLTCSAVYFAATRRRRTS